MTHDEFRARLLVACGLDPEVLIGSHEDAILSVVHHKVTHGDERISAAQRWVERYREMAEGEHGARLEAEAQRDAAIAVCRWLCEAQAYFAEHALSEERMPGNDFYSDKFMAVVRAAREVVAKATTEPTS